MAITTLDEWMEKRGYKDASLAAELKTISRSQVSRIRRRKSIPTLETARALEAFTKIPAATFLTTERA